MSAGSPNLPGSRRAVTLAATPASCSGDRPTVPTAAYRSGRGDGIDADAARRQFGGQRLRDRLERCLARAVDGEAGKADLGQEGGDELYRRPFAQQRQEAAHRLDGTEQVDRELRLERCPRAVLEADDARDAGVRDGTSTRPWAARVSSTRRCRSASCVTSPTTGNTLPGGASASACSARGCGRRRRRALRRRIARRWHDRCRCWRR